MKLIKKTLNYTDQTLKEIEAIKKYLGTPSMTEVVRRCIHYFYESNIFKKGA